MNMQLRQCFARAKTFRLKNQKKPAFDFQKIPSALKKLEYQNLASTKPNWQH